MCIAPLSNIGNVLIYLFNLFKLFNFLYGMTHFLNFLHCNMSPKIWVFANEIDCFLQGLFRATWYTRMTLWNTCMILSRVDGRTHRGKLNTRGSWATVRHRGQTSRNPRNLGAKHRRAHCPADRCSLNTQYVCLKVSEEFNFNLCSVGTRHHTATSSSKDVSRTKWFSPAEELQW
jgi:hypothetical protein